MWIDDDILRRSAERLAIACWVPERPVVVLGSSNQAAVEVDMDACARDDVPILKRYGGGGTVLLYPGSLVVSIGAWVRQPYQNRLYFTRLNQALIDTLALRWPTLARMDQRGLSDITWDDRKLVGTSLFRSRNYLLYQASILVEADPVLIGRYLKHPSREPDYRRGRGHGGFLMGLRDVEPAATAVACRDLMESTLSAQLERLLVDDLLAPIDEQRASLLRRAEGLAP